jgi:outer membrane protein assembly factor BamB
MPRRRTLPYLLLLALISLPLAASAAPPKFAAGDWPRWRGPTADGVAEANQQPPLKWSKTENVLWKAPVIGRGHSSPTVVGDQVFLATADEDKEIQSVLSFDRATGAARWKTDVHTGGLERKGNKKSTQASSSVACDGERLFINFLHNGSIYTTALDLKGKRLWQTKVSAFSTHQGFGSSPALFEDLVYVTTDSPGGGAVAALKRETGDIVWSEPRPEKANYASPIVLKVAGKQQLIVFGCDLVSSFEPLTGKKLWEVEGSTTECVTTAVTDGSRVFVSGGYPKKFTGAIEGDGSGKTAWENVSQVYVPSMIVHEGHLYALLDNGLAACWKCDTGEEKWKTRLSGGFTASLVLVGDNLFGTNESGTTFIFKASPEKLELVGENQLGDEAYATPSICGSRIYVRVVENVDGKRQEMLYCLGEK